MECVTQIRGVDGDSIVVELLSKVNRDVMQADRRKRRRTLIKTSLYRSFCERTSEFVEPAMKERVPVSLSTSSCWSGVYGPKRLPCSRSAVYCYYVVVHRQSDLAK